MIKVATDFSGNHKRIKHFILRVNYLIEEVTNGIIDLQYLPTEDQTADILTKPLPPIQFI